MVELIENLLIAAGGLVVGIAGAYCAVVWVFRNGIK